ncbi:MAG: ribulokinase [Oscillospiraceae bacterium]|jgi:L-ribulokinase|nr:ribulokinase [Oscillospiraceae bacterium]
MKTYTIGIDFGTLSARAVLIDTASGDELASCVYKYPHAVMDRSLPCGTVSLPPDWALQHPGDYLEALEHTVPEVVRQSGVDSGQIIGIGTDFTGCTVLPVKADRTPLCFLPEFEKNPHAYVKLWKHHAAQDKASRLNGIAEERGEPWLRNYGGKISSEWNIPKLWQVLDEAPEVYAAMDRWVEAADWIVWRLSGVETRNACSAGYKAIYSKSAGFPANDFFKALDPRFDGVIERFFALEITPPGTKVGGVTPEMAKKLGVQPGTAVAAGILDAHVCAPAVGIGGPGTMLAVMGTSACHMLMGTEELQVPGICGVVADGILPGFYGYEAGQCCVGDHFAWFVDNCAPSAYAWEAKARKVSLHTVLREKAEELRPGESGLIALDWWNGNRSILVDADLTGLLIGMTLRTKPEEIYRALIEATAYGAREIIENYRAYGVSVDAFVASGGISQKDPMTMQIYADVLNLPIQIAGSENGPAYGSAIFAAVAAGKEAGGYDDIFSAARVLGKRKDTVYRPNPENAAVYDELYADYKILHDHFGRGGNDVMKRLKKLKAGV